jgi:signal transduction histidine kinase
MSTPPLVRRIDWCQLWYPGRKTPFSAAEMASAGRDAPGPTLVARVLLNALSLAALAGFLAPQGQRGATVGLLMLMTAAGTGLAWALWWRPWRRPLMWATLAVMALMIGSAVLVRQLLPQREDREGLAVALSSGGALLVILLWFLVVWRAQQIEGRLREQAERERAVEMARRLAAAQLEPHFLFNTLASLQHWVQTKDDRAAPLLAALTGYLRGTLPLFHRPQLTLGEELEAVRHYLGVMALRMGPRLQWQLDVPAPLQALPLPPGLLLTLVENAVVHGLEPRVGGGRLTVQARAEGTRAVLEVQDDGGGLAPGWHDGIGLANVRERLALLHGDAAHLELAPGSAGGCVARVTLPLNLAAA